MVKALSALPRSSRVLVNVVRMNYPTTRYCGSDLIKKLIQKRNDKTITKRPLARPFCERPKLQAPVEKQLTLAELFPTTCLVEADFFTFDFTGITRNQTSF